MKNWAKRGRGLGHVAFEFWDPPIISGSDEATDVKFCSRIEGKTRSSATADELRDALRQLKYYGRFLTELWTKSSANAQELCEHTVS